MESVKGRSVSVERSSFCIYQEVQWSQVTHVLCKFLFSHYYFKISIGHLFTCGCSQMCIFPLKLRPPAASND